mmetsp:Transcript_23430/g.41144  ORF Transcript_23430/g.41144 Transcript_23430/m.41144 type:complete len:224 (-) Transcript_23430:259-930(-)
MARKSCPRSPHQGRRHCARDTAPAQATCPQYQPASPQVSGLPRKARKAAHPQAGPRESHQTRPKPLPVLRSLPGAPTASVRSDQRAPRHAHCARPDSCATGPAWRCPPKPEGSPPRGQRTLRSRGALGQAGPSTRPPDGGVRCPSSLPDAQTPRHWLAGCGSARPAPFACGARPCGQSGSGPTALPPGHPGPTLSVPAFAIRAPCPAPAGRHRAPLQSTAGSG